MGNRVFIVDIAIGVEQLVPGEDKRRLTEFMRFVSLDGVHWNDPMNADKLEVGNAVSDLLRLTRDYGLEPVKREKIDRVVGSAALKMFDHNLIIMPKPLADHGTPIVINNACASWHRLAPSMVYGNARAYIGTLHPVTSLEAEVVLTKLLEKHFDKPLPHALWSAQREAYPDISERRPYVIAGVYPQRIRLSNKDFLPRMVSRLSGALKDWERHQASVDPADADRVRLINEGVAFYRHELGYFNDLAGKSGGGAY